ncbi:thioredoxin family protein [Bacteriovoracaceae bacterium]|nr:thioredoxin family protein [Bacteriovoracaceae bacterium]
MAKTESKMIALDTIAPDFTLNTCFDESIHFNSIVGKKGYLIAFICNHCPYVIRIREGLNILTKNLQEKGLSVLCINSNDVDNYPEDSIEKMKEYAEKYHFPFSYLFDPTQEVAKAYSATCTPDFFLFNSDRKLFYRGRMDKANPSNEVDNNGIDILNAADEMLAGRISPEIQIPSIGCNIKWKKD